MLQVQNQEVLVTGWVCSFLIGGSLPLFHNFENGEHSCRGHWLLYPGLGGKGKAQAQSPGRGPVATASGESSRAVSGQGL